MLVPLGVLTLGAIAAGYLFKYDFIYAEEGGTAFWAASTLYFNEHLIHAMHHVPLWVKLASTVAMLTGLFTAWMMYIRKPGSAQALAGHFEPLYKFFLNNYHC